MSKECVEALADLDWIHPRSMALFQRESACYLGTDDLSKSYNEGASKIKKQQHVGSTYESQLDGCTPYSVSTSVRGRVPRCAKRFTIPILSPIRSRALVSLFLVIAATLLNKVN